MQNKRLTVKSESQQYFSCVITLKTWSVLGLNPVETF